MTSSLPSEVRQIFHNYITTEYTVIDGRGRPITWPLIPFYEDCAETIEVTTGLGYPKKANDARRNPQVSLLFSDPKGSGLDGPAMVLVQGVARVDDSDLDLNRRRYHDQCRSKLPDMPATKVPTFFHRVAPWYFARIYIEVRPERVFIWPGGDPQAEPELHDTHMEEIRTGHFEGPEASHAPPEGGGVSWDERLAELGARYPSAAVSWIAPDGFPVTIRLPVEVDHQRRRVRIMKEPQGIPLAPGSACITAHDHDEQLAWTLNFQVRGDLLQEDGAWVLIPHRLVGGLEMPPTGLRRWIGNARKIRRFHRMARRELRHRAGTRPQ